MDAHKNASLTPKGRAHLVSEIARIGLIPAAEAAGISTRTARKWQRRFAAEGTAGLLDRSSRPLRWPRASDASKKVRAVALRRTQRLTYAQIAERVGPVQEHGGQALPDRFAGLLYAARSPCDGRSHALQRQGRLAGAAYRSRRFAKLLRRLKIKHIRTRPYTSRTNGKAERFIQTLLREWAYAYCYPSSDYRGNELRSVNTSEVHQPRGRS
jgi:transposase InsO family protein